MSEKEFTFEFEKDTINQNARPPIDIVKDISELTGLSQLVIKDVLSAYTSIAIKELVINGIFRWPGIIAIKRGKVNKPTRKYIANEDVTIELPCDYRVNSKVAGSLRKLSRDYMNGLIAEENGMSYEDWYKPYIVFKGYDENDGAGKISLQNRS